MPFWYLLTFMTSIMVDSPIYLLRQIIIFAAYLAVITAAYAILLRLIIAFLFAAADLFFEGWDPGPDARRPSTRRQRRRRPKHSPHHQRWETGPDARHPPSVRHHLCHRRNRHPSPTFTSIHRLIVVFLRFVFDTHDATPPVHHHPRTPRTSIPRLVVVLLYRVIRLIVGLLRHVHRQPWYDSVAAPASVDASACPHVAAHYVNTMHLNPPIGCCVSPPRSPCTSSHRWIVVCIRESEIPNFTASASSHVAASVAASAASSVASSDNVPSDVEPSVHSHPWEAPMTTLLQLIFVLFRRHHCL